jgi:hypothetical protein
LALEYLCIDGDSTIPSTVKLPDVKDLDLTGSPSPRVLQVVSGFSKLETIMLTCCLNNSSLEMLKILGKNLKAVDIYGAEKNFSLDLVDFISSFPRIVRLHVMSVSLKPIVDLDALNGGLPYLKEFSLELSSNALFTSNGLLRTLLCAEKFPQLEYLDLHGVYVSDTEFHQTTSDLALLAATDERKFSGRFRVTQGYSEDFNRASYVAFMRQACMTLNISPDGLHLPVQLWKLKRVEDAYKRFDVFGI